jgi:drug/metabolite transporter (DMT)-like permease
LNPKSLPYILLTGLAFGTGLVVSRFGLSQFDPYLYTGLRLGLASLGFVAIYLLDRRRAWPLNPRMWRYTAVMGILGTALPMTAMLLSLQFLSSGLAAILITTGPAIIVVLAHFFLADEFLTARKSLGVMLALGGAILLAIRGESGLANSGQSSLTGYLLIGLVLLSTGFLTIYARKYLREFDTIDVTFIQIFIAAVVMIPVALLLAGLDFQRVTSQGWLAILYSAAVGNVIGFLSYFHTIKRFGATAAAMTGYVVPVVASLAGTFLLDEQITGGMVGGMAIIVAGLVILNSKG